MSSPGRASRAAERWLDRLGLNFEHLLGIRFAINVFIATTVEWVTLREIGDSNPIWAIASMVAAADPQPEEVRRLFRGRLINVLVGCGVGFCLLVVGRGGDWCFRFWPATTMTTSATTVFLCASLDAGRSPRLTT